MSPGLAVDKFIMSSRELAAGATRPAAPVTASTHPAAPVTASTHPAAPVTAATRPAAPVHLWRPGLAMEAMLRDGWDGALDHPTTGEKETLLSLLCWDCVDVRDSLLPGEKEREKIAFIMILKQH
jgi:hypothetical protein